MSKVQILPPEIVSKIAAGEVIERPASVLKELLENSLDAKATSLEIELKKAGKNSLVVKDNGSGIAQDDLEKIFFRHATSKITSLDDLYAIHSLGFRGEALYSIASIADIILRSKTEGQDSGFEIHQRGGKKISLKPVNMSVGTQVEVKELFFNTPARKKFLKADTTEMNQILNIFIPYAILNPKCRFLLTHNDKTLFDLMPDKDLKARAAQVLNLDEKDIIEVERRVPEENLSIRLLLGNINIQRSRRDQQFIFVNGRPVQHRNLA